MSGEPKVDNSGRTVAIRPDGLVLVDGIVVFRRVVGPSGVRIQFCDNDRMRSQCRGTRLVEVPLASLVTVLDIFKERDKDNHDPNQPED